jgi:hypothetical protein
MRTAQVGRLAATSELDPEPQQLAGHLLRCGTAAAEVVEAKEERVLEPLVI